MIVVDYPKNRKDYVGLCNFLKTLYTCYYINSDFLKNENDIKCVSSNIKNLYLSLFEDENKILHHKNIDKISYDEIHTILHNNQNYRFLDWRFYLPEHLRTRIKKYTVNQLNSDSKFEIDLKYSNIPVYIQKIYIEIIKKFKINPVILNYLDNFIEKNKNYVGVHIRTWTTNLIGDKYPFLKERHLKYLSTKNQFIEKINSEPNKNIVICSDNYNEIKKNIIPHIQNKNIILNETVKELNHHQNNMLELLILSKSQKIIGTLNSTFTELAWWYADCNIPVTII